MLSNSHYGWVTERIAAGDDEYEVNQAVADALYEAGITHILDCRDDSEIFYLRRPKGFQADKRFEYLYNPTNDDGKPKPVEWFALGIGFVRGALFDPQAKVYIHCQAGLNRSTSLAYGVLRSLSYGAKKAEGRIMHARPQAGLLYRDDAERALRVLGFTT